MKRITSVLCSFFLLTTSPIWVTAQDEAPTALVTIPTAGSLHRGQYEFEILMQRGGGILPRLAIGFTDRFTFGMSYGIQYFVGDSLPTLNRPTPEVQVKYRLYDESLNMPAIALGLDTQGRGNFRKIEQPTVERYDIKAIGAYLVASKNWQALGNFGGHLGVCKNFWEDAKNDDDLNVFFGFDKDVTPTISLFAEYNAALDDNDYKLEDISFGQDRGYLNAGFRWYVSPSLKMEIDFNDILLNKDAHVKYVNRELKIIYSEYF